MLCIPSNPMGIEYFLFLKKQQEFNLFVPYLEYIIGCWRRSVMAYTSPRSVRGVLEGVAS